jgi:hypothetical protein
VLAGGTRALASQGGGAAPERRSLLRAPDALMGWLAERCRPGESEGLRAALDAYLDAAAAARVGDPLHWLWADLRRTRREGAEAGAGA